MVLVCDIVLYVSRQHFIPNVNILYKTYFVYQIPVTDCQNVRTAALGTTNVNVTVPKD